MSTAVGASEANLLDVLNDPELAVQSVELARPLSPSELGEAVEKFSLDDLAVAFGDNLHSATSLIAIVAKTDPRIALGLTLAIAGMSQVVQVMTEKIRPGYMASVN